MLVNFDRFNEYQYFGLLIAALISNHPAEERQAVRLIVGFFVLEAGKNDDFARGQTELSRYAALYQGGGVIDARIRCNEVR